MKNKYLVSLLAVVAGSLFFLASPTAHAVTAITGGSSFGTAVELKAGNYSGGVIVSDQPQYYYVTVSQGQQLSVQGSFISSSTTIGTLNSMFIYDADKKELVDSFDSNYSSTSLTASWLSNSDQPTYKYYVAVTCDGENTASYTLAVSVTNRYDAGSTQDAPSTFDKAAVITAGTTTGFLGGGISVGNDEIDMYQFAASADGTYAIKLTPPTEAQMTMTVYDANRQQLDSQTAGNNGGTIASSFTATKGTITYIKLECGVNCSSKLVDYSLAITAGAVINSNTVNTNAATNSATEDENVNLDTAATTNANTASESEKSDSTTIIYIVIGAVFLLLVIIIVILLARKKKEPQQPQKS